MANQSNWLTDSAPGTSLKYTQNYTLFDYDNDFVYCQQLFVTCNNNNTNNNNLLYYNR